MRFTVLLLASFAALSASSAACSIRSDSEAPKLQLGTSTDGPARTLEFAYSGRDCVLGCALDRPALQGSLVTVVASGEFDTNATARIGNTAIATIAAKRFSCSDPKQCSLSVDIETNEPGDPTLEILDGHGDLIDLVTVQVRPAARIDVTVGGGTDVGGVHQVKRFSRVTIASRVYDAQNVELAFEKHGMSFDYANKSIVQPDPSAIFGSTDVEDMIATGTGETSVRVFAPGAERVVRLRVVP